MSSRRRVVALKWRHWSIETGPVTLTSLRGQALHGLDLHVLPRRRVALWHYGVVGVALYIARCVLFQNLRCGAMGEGVVQTDACVPHVGNAKKIR